MDILNIVRTVHYYVRKTEINFGGVVDILNIVRTVHYYVRKGVQNSG